MSSDLHPSDFSGLSIGLDDRLCAVLSSRCFACLASLSVYHLTGRGLRPATQKSIFPRGLEQLIFFLFFWTFFHVSFGSVRKCQFSPQSSLRLQNCGLFFVSFLSFFHFGQQKQGLMDENERKVGLFLSLSLTIVMAGC